MLVAKDFEILRGLNPDCRKGIPHAREPKRVLTLLNEKLFQEDKALIHHKTVFFEDKTHDWDYRNGKLYYYARAEDGMDVVLVYEEAEVELPPKFCTETGKRLVA